MHGFKSLDHLHDQVGNFRTKVDGQRAKVRCYGIVYHYRAKISVVVKSRIFVSACDIDLSAQSDRWRIGLLKFNLKFIGGNLELEKAT